MGNLLPSIGLFGGDTAVCKEDSGGRFITRRISQGITYYYAPFSRAKGTEETVCAAKNRQNSNDLCPISPSAMLLSHSSSSSSSSSSSDSPSHTPFSSQSRPLLVFFSWLGARPAAVAKYRDLYLDRNVDVLLVQSNVMHFLWPRWGLDYGLEVLKVLEEPRFSERPVLVHSTSIGGYTFTQMLSHIAQGHKEHAGLAQRVIGHVYDSLVAGSLEDMAIGLGKTLLPHLESLVKNAAMFYFWLFKSHTADFYNSSILVFRNNPITVPALFFYSENDALCNPAHVEKVINIWRRRGVTVESRKWKESKHAAHIRCHPEDYLSTLEKYLNSLHIPALRTKM